MKKYLQITLSFCLVFYVFDVKATSLAPANFFIPHNWCQQNNTPLALGSTDNSVENSIRLGERAIKYWEFLKNMPSQEAQPNRGPEENPQKDPSKSDKKSVWLIKNQLRNQSICDLHYHREIKFNVENISNDNDNDGDNDGDRDQNVEDEAVEHLIEYFVPESSTSYNGPSKTSRKDIFDDYVAILEDMPKSLYGILVEGKDFSALEKIKSDELEINKTAIAYLYQKAVRFQHNLGKISYLRLNAKKDVRGYLTLKNTVNLEDKLKHWDKLSEIQRETFKNALFGLCKNRSYIAHRNAIRFCYQEVQWSIGTDSVWEQYEQLKSFGERVYQEYFKIPSSQVRSFVTWNEQSKKWEIPFILPQRETGDGEDHFKFVAKSFEEEWSWQGVGVKLIETTTNNNNSLLPNLKFEQAALPHVSYSEMSIYMDKNTPLNDSGNSHVMAHEMGHILGLPDCYVEFYDAEEDSFIYYSLDDTDLMCSLNGTILPRHLEEIQRVYGTNNSNPRPVVYGPF